ncbi:MAG: hypothetical protein AB7I35_05880 [Ramlibacter sp.]
MKHLPLLPLQIAALSLAVVRGLGEFASLQAWRLRDRLARRG